MAKLKFFEPPEGSTKIRLVPPDDKALDLPIHWFPIGKGSTMFIGEQVNCPFCELEKQQGKKDES